MGRNDNNCCTTKQKQIKHCKKESINLRSGSLENKQDHQTLGTVNQKKKEITHTDRNRDEQGSLTTGSKTFRIL